MGRLALCAAVGVLSTTAGASAGLIGPWDIADAPTDATVLSGGRDNWGWLNTLNAPVTIQEAFTGLSIIERSFDEEACRSPPPRRWSAPASCSR